MKYRREIDGLRTVAVLPVILFHAGFEAFQGGFVGVDVFFVISGYLITTIILCDINKKKFSIVTFYERRARRILPALFFVMLCCLPFAWLFLLPSHLKDFSQSLIAVSVFLSNILFWRESGYFGAASELKPLLHTWSLAVEEQYYVLFPLFLMALWKLGKRWIFGALMAVSALSLAAAQWGAYHKPFAAFFLLPTRVWELGIGALIAFYFFYKSEHANFIKLRKNTSEILGAVGLFLICYAIFSFDKNTPFPSFYALIPTVGAGLIIIFSTPDTVVGRFLGIKPIVGIGLLSYSAYLWHQPLFVFVRHVSLTEPNTVLLLVLSVTSILLAYPTWRFVENPFRNKTVIRRRSLFFFAVLGSVAFAVIGCAGYFGNYFHWAGMLNPLNKNIQLANYTGENKILQQSSWDILREISGDKSYGVEDNAYDEKLWFDLSSNKLKLILVGNSYSKDLFNVLWNSKTAKSKFDVARYGAQISNLDYKHKMFSAPNYVQSDIVVIVTRFDSESDDTENLSNLVEKIINDGKRAVIVKNIFEFPVYKSGEMNLFDRVVYESWLNYEKNPTAIANTSDRVHYEVFKTEYMRKGALSANLEITRISEVYSDVIVLDRMDYICDAENEKCFSADSNLNKFFYDFGHHTLDGAEFFGQRIDKINWLGNLNFI